MQFYNVSIRIVLRALRHVKLSTPGSASHLNRRLVAPPLIPCELHSLWTLGELTSTWSGGRCPRYLDKLINPWEWGSGTRIGTPAKNSSSLPDRIPSSLFQLWFCFLPPGVDILVEPLRATLQTKVKANSVKQEFEKQDELKRSALRAVAALLSIPDSGKWLR